MTSFALWNRQSSLKRNILAFLISVIVFRLMKMAICCESYFKHNNAVSLLIGSLQIKWPTAYEVF